MNPTSADMDAEEDQAKHRILDAVRSLAACYGLPPLEVLVLACEALPPRGQNASTHWDGCWRHRDHHVCAVKAVESAVEEVIRLRALVSSIEAEGKAP